MKLINIKLMAGQAALKPAILIDQGDSRIILACPGGHSGVDHKLYGLMFIEDGHGPGNTQSPVSLFVALFTPINGRFSTGRKSAIERDILPVFKSIIHMR